MKMTTLKKTVAYLISVPARIKGMRFGKNSFIGPGYDIAPALRGVTLGDNVLIGRRAWLDISRYTENARIIIGDGTQIGRNVMMSAAEKIVIGKECLVSYNVSFLDHDHNFVPDVSLFKSGISAPNEIVIKDGCFIGAHSFILKGVHLGKQCVVGANSVVVNSFPDYSVVAGNPAKLLKSLK
jgi:acetyltransferase-like isoleucine patch superfamily enzyme